MRTTGIGLILTGVGLAGGLALTTYVEWRYYGLRLSFALGDFGTHPVLMATGFLVLAPAGACVYAIGDWIHGLEHQPSERNQFAMKFSHALLHFCALVCGCFGVYSIWLTHENEKTHFHFQTLHSWIGIGVLAIFGLQWLGGFCVFVLFDAKTVRARFVAVHVAMGRLLIYGGLIVCLLGSLATVWKVRDAEPHPWASGLPDWTLQNVGGLLMLLELVAIYTVLEWRSRASISSKRLLLQHANYWRDQPGIGQSTVKRLAEPLMAYSSMSIGELGSSSSHTTQQQQQQQHTYPIV